MTITFSCFIVYLKTITAGGYSLCFSPQFFIREILKNSWDGFLKFIARCVLFLSTLISNLTSIPKQTSYYILVINLSVSICYLEYSHKPYNKTFFQLQAIKSIRCVYASVLTTNTHTYQSFILLKSSDKNRVNNLRCF